jgi:hypothetical protein
MARLRGFAVSGKKGGGVWIRLIWINANFDPAAVIYNFPVRVQRRTRAYARLDLHCRGRRRPRRIRPLCRRIEKGLTMIVQLIYGAAALVVAAFMVAALLRPDKF